MGERELSRTIRLQDDQIIGLQALVTELRDSVVEMATYNDVPGARKDPVWLAIWKRGAAVVAKANEIAPTGSVGAVAEPEGRSA